MVRLLLCKCPKQSENESHPKWKAASYTDGATPGPSSPMPELPREMVEDAGGKVELGVRSP